MLHFLEKAPPTNEISDNLNSLWVPVQIPSPLWASVSHLQQRGSRVRWYPRFIPALTRKAAQLLLHCGCVCVCPSPKPGCTADAPDGQVSPVMRGVGSTSLQSHPLLITGSQGHTLPSAGMGHPLSCLPLTLSWGHHSCPPHAECPAHHIARNSYNSPAGQVLLPCFTHGETEAQLGQVTQ